jgi:CheY-like chemotaxis protein
MNMTLSDRRIASMRKVLVVEDVDFNRELIVQLLEDKYQVIEAVNGQQGVELAERERPELILMDLSLPIMDGWEATRRLKASADLRSIPVIALTAHAMKGDKEKALAAGCDDYLAKPLDEDELMARIAKYLK